MSKTFETPAASPATAPAPRRRHWLLLWLLIPAVLGGLWWWHAPWHFRVIGHYPMASPYFESTPQGFILHEDGARFVLRDWHGRRRWTMRVPEPRHPRLAGASAWLHGFWETVSYDGRYFGCVAAEDDHLHYQLYRDGLRVADRRIDNLPRYNPRIMVTDAGRVFIWAKRSDGQPQPLILFDREREVARGVLPSSGVLFGNGKTMVMPETAGRFRYATLELRGHDLTWRLRYISTDPLTFQDFEPYGIYISGIAPDYVIADNDAVYNARGRVSGPGPWRHEVPYGGYRYIVQAQGAMRRVYAPASGDAWTFRVGGSDDVGSATRDGRYVILFIWPDAHRHFYERLTARLPKSGELLDARLNRKYIAVYERPGRLRAMQRLDTEQWWRGPGNDDDDFWANYSPDGKALVILLSGNRPAGGKAYQATVLRW